MKYIKKQDTRTLNSETKYKLRLQIIRLKKKGKKAKEISKYTGYSEVQISRIWQAYCNYGPETVGTQLLGRPTGSSSIAQEKSEVCEIVGSTRPFELEGLAHYSFWCPRALQEFLFLRYRIRISLSTSRKYLKDWGFSDRRPRQWSLWNSEPKHGFKNFFRTLRRIGF